MRRALGTIGLGLLLVVVAGLFDVASLYVPGVGFAALGLLAAMWVRVAASQASVTRELEVRSAIEGDPVRARLIVRARLRLPTAAIVDPLLEEPLALPSGSGSCELHATVRFARRGRRPLTPPSLVLRDPLGLARHVVPGSGAHELLVLPRISEIAVASRGSDAGRSGRAAALLSATANEIDGLRPYREGTSAARIHWQTLARGGGLMERRLRSDGDARPLVVLDARAPASEEALDAAVRAATSLCDTFARSGGCALLLPGERRATTIGEDLAAWPAAHVRLALVEGGPGTPAPAMGATGVRRGPLLYVAARTIEALPVSTRTVARGSSTLVVPGELSGREPTFTVAGCSGYAMTRRSVEVDAA
ncbi:MAG: hypothetical protein JWQ48_3870 [Conexibacter sp.]|nr:hypothetical protein [Conexibacter sp.]